MAYVSSTLRENNKCHLTIFLYQSTLKVEVRCVSWSCTHQPKLATNCGQLIQLALLKWPQIRHKGTLSHAKWHSHHVLPIWFENFKKFMQKIKLRVPFVKHQPKSLLASSKAHYGMMWYVTLWPQNTIWTNLKVFHTLFTNFAQP